MLSATVETTEPFGNIWVNPDAPASERIRLRETVDYIKVFNGLLRGLSNQKDPVKGKGTEQGLAWFKQQLPEFRFNEIPSDGGTSSKVIKEEDVINFSFSQTENIYTKIIF